MILRPPDQHGASFVEILMVMGTIMILSATALVFYSGQMYKAHSIVIVHDLRRFSSHVQTTFYDNNMIPFEKGRIITTHEPLKDFSPSKDVVMTITDVDKIKPYGKNLFITIATLKKAIASIDMKTHAVTNLSKFEYEHFQEKLINLISFFFSSVGLTAIVVTMVTSIIALVALRK